MANKVVDEACKKDKIIFVFKIDLEKAYDSVDFSFLLEMMNLNGLKNALGQ